MSKQNRLKFMNYAKGNTHRLSDRLLTKYYQDYTANSKLFDNAIKENNFDIKNVVNNSDKATTSIVKGTKKVRLLNINSKTQYSYYGIIKSKRGLSPSWLPKYTIQDTYYSGITRDSYKLKRHPLKVTEINNQVDIITDDVRKELNRRFITRYENSHLKLVANSKLKFDKYYKSCK